MKVIKSIKSQPVKYMCHADTYVSHEIRDEQILQFSFQLTDTVGAKKKCPLTRGVWEKFGQDWSYFRKFITFIPVFEVFQVTRRHRGNFGQRKERKK